MSNNQVCTGACIFGKCPFETCIKHKQGKVHKSIKADMSILTQGNLPSLNTGKQGYGIAVDIGTTTVAAYLYDFAAGHCVDIQSSINPQASFGVDVISRIKYCRDQQEGLGELNTVIIQCINNLCEKLCANQEIKIAAVTEMSITGNTTMLHLLANIDPSPMGEAPFPMPSAFGIKYSAEQLGIIGSSNVYLANCMSSFVGGDITTAILSSDMQKDDVSLLLDIGTNGEVALHADGKILVSSTAAGPAFEGAELSCGMAAVAGAVNSVDVVQGKIITTTIGDKPAKGICGSGVIDALTLMKTSGTMDETGRIEDGPHTIEIEGEPAFVLTEGVYITQRDVRRIQTAKSAIAAGVLALIHSAGLNIQDVQNVYLAGGFGNYMNEHNAVQIGLLPTELLPKLKNIGNAAGAGAGMALLSVEYQQQCKSIADASKHIELSTDAYFMDKYIDCMMF